MRFRDDVRADFYTALALTLRSADLETAVNEAARATGSSRHRRKLLMVAADVSDGLPLWEALERQSSLFPRWETFIVRTGENAGKLGEVIGSLTEGCGGRHVEVARFWRNWLITAFWLVFVLSLALLFLLGVVPKFRNMYSTILYGEPLPFLTDLLISLSDFVAKRALVVAGGFLAVFIVYVVFAWGVSATQKRPFALLPWHSDYLLERDCERLCRLIATSLTCGRSLETATARASAFVKTMGVKELSRMWADAMSNGSSFQDGVALRPIPNGPLRLFQDAAAVLDPSHEAADFHVLARTYRDRAEVIVPNLNAMFAAILILLTVGAGVAVMAMFLPLLKLIVRLG